MSARSVAIVGEWDSSPKLGPTLRAEAFAAGLRHHGFLIQRVGFRSLAGDNREPQFRFFDADDRAVLGATLPEHMSVIVAAGTWASLAAVHGAAPEAGVWCDFFGDPIAEALARARRLGSRQPILNARYLTSTVLQRADALSVVSRRQKLAAAAEIGLTGAPERLGTPISVLPCALPALPRDRQPRSTCRAIVSGSANSWVDYDLLLAALGKARRSVPQLEVDITGGALPGYDEQTFESLQSSVRRSAPDWLCVHGWLDPAAFAAVLSQADFGIVPETGALERELGSANRCLEWISHGIPFLLSSQSELAGDLAEAGAAELFEAGNEESLARGIEKLASDPVHRQTLARNAAALAQARWTPEAVTEPLAAWVRETTFQRVSGLRAQPPSLTPPEPSPMHGSCESWEPWRLTVRRLARRAATRLARKARERGVAARAGVRAFGAALGTGAGLAGSGAAKLAAASTTVGRFVYLVADSARLAARSLRFRTSGGRPSAGPIGSRRPAVLVVSPYPLVPRASGGSVRVHGLLEALADHAEIIVLAFSNGRDDPAQRAALGFARHVELVGHERGAAEGRDLLPPNVRPFRSTELRHRIRDLAAEFGADIVQLEFTEFGWYLDAPPRGLPTLLTEHDVCSVSALRRRHLLFHRRFVGDGRLWGEWLDWLRLFRFEVQACDRADQVHAMSPSDGRILARFLRSPAKVHVVPNAASIPQHLVRESESPDRVLFVGFFGHSPNRDGMEWFIHDVWPLVRRLRPTAELTVVGGMPPAELRRWHGEDGVTIAGQVPSVTPWLESAAVFVVPIRAGSGTRLKLLDALSHGVACVSTRIGAEGLDAHDREHLRFADDVDSFAQAVVELLADPAERAQLGHAGRQLVEEKYSWKASAEVALAGYRELMARHPTPPRPTAVVDPLPAGAPPRISVVIPTFRGGGRLLEVLDAVFAQVGAPAFEVVCVDSGSSPEDVAAMRECGARVVSIPNEAFDHGLARDLGAKVGRGEVLVFLNQDAMPCNPYWLALLTEPLLRPGRHDAIQGGIVEIPERTGRFFWDSGGDRFYYTRETASWIAEYSGLGFSTVNCAIRRSAWEAIHFGWAPIMEDKKWQARATRQGRSIGQRHQAAVAHSHDWTSGGLWRRCRAEGEGWALLDRPYTFGDMLSDLVHRRTWRTWAAAMKGGQLRSRAELLFPLIRPLALWRGSRRITNPNSPHRPRIRYAPAIVESTT